MLAFKTFAGCFVVLLLLGDKVQLNIKHKRLKCESFCKAKKKTMVKVDKPAFIFNNRFDNEMTQ
jgi:hypothetical protein